MNDDDALNRAKQALQVSRPRRTEFAAPLPDQSKIDALLARAREAAEVRLQTQAITPAVDRPPLRLSIAVGRPAKAPLAKATKVRGGKWVCIVCGVPGCMFEPRWVVDE